MTEILLSRTKVVVPTRRPEIITRERLLDLLYNILDKKMILVTAPAGYGKTSLLIDLAHRAEMPVCWLSLDALDGEPQRFIAYLIAAITQQFPEFGSQSQAVLKSMTSLEQDAERLVVTLVNEIDEQIGEHFILILDDYQFIDGIPFIANFIGRFILLSGENFHLIISSRSLVSLPEIIILAARQQVEGFDLEQLAFHPDEIRALFVQNHGIKLSDETIGELLRRTEGWITGLHLSAAGAARGVPDLGHAARAASVDLSDYFNRQVLAPQPPELHEFLLHTSLLDEFDADLCSAVLGPGKWKRLLETVKRSNLFVLPVGSGGQWLRYHHLFQDFLRSQIEAEDPHKAKEIRERLARVYEQRGEWEKAYYILHQMGKSEALAELIERAGIPMLLSERLITFKNWLEDLSPWFMQTRPILLSHQGALLCGLGDGRAALPLLDQAITILRESNDFHNLSLALVRRAAAHRTAGDYACALQDTEEALRLSEGRPELVSTFAEAERFKGLSLFRLGRIKEAVPFLEDALQRFERLGETQSIARVRMGLGMIYSAIGNYAAARNAYERSLAEWRKENNLYSQSVVLNNLGVVHHLQGSYEEAILTFEEGLKCAQRSSSRWQEAITLVSIGDVYADLDEYGSAAQAYNQANVIARQINYQYLTNYLALAQTRLSRLRGQFEQASFWLNESRALITPEQSRVEYGLLCLESGCLHLAGGNAAAAIGELEQALEYFLRSALHAETCCSRLWLAAAYIGCGEVAAARSQVRGVFGIAHPDRAPHSLITTVRRTNSWLAKLREDAEVGRILSPWLERAAQAEAGLPSLHKRLRQLTPAIPIRPPHLTIRAFGKAQVKLNGKLVTTAQWQTTSVRDLFFYFLSSQRPVTKEGIGEAFWPEISPAQLNLRFKNGIYRLRRALGQEVVLFENGLYRFNRAMDYEYDVETFQTYLEQAQDAADSEKKIASLRAAVDLVHGLYLQDVDSPWVWSKREHMEQAHIVSLKTLAALYHQAGCLEAALEICRRALGVDPCLEEIHCLAMQIHAGRGDRPAIARQYCACRDALHEELGISPSAETEKLYQHLIA